MLQPGRCNPHRRWVPAAHPSGKKPMSSQGAARSPLMRGASGSGDHQNQADPSTPAARPPSGQQGRTYPHRCRALPPTPRPRRPISRQRPRACRPRGAHRDLKPTMDVLAFRDQARAHRTARWGRASRALAGRYPPPLGQEPDCLSGRGALPAYARRIQLLEPQIDRLTPPRRARARVCSANAGFGGGGWPE